MSSGRPPAAWTPATRAAPVAGESDRVLLVEDDAVSRLLVSGELARRGWEVVEAASVPEAIDRFRECAPHAVLLDALMPGEDGFQACQRIRALQGGEDVPVLMLTSLDDEPSIARAYAAGATDYFVKSGGRWTLLSERLRYLLRTARMRRELLASQDKLTKAQRIARLGSWEWVFAEGQIHLSDEGRSVLGLPASQDILGEQDAWERLPSAERERILQLYLEARRRGSGLTFETSVPQGEGRERIVRVEAELERVAGGVPSGMHGVIQDVTERRNAEEQIRRLANYDSLTGLPNRRYLREEFGAALERAAARSGTMALLFLDVDRFKSINDNLGHDIGDQVLREVAWRLHSVLRESDTVARASGRARRGDRAAPGAETVVDDREGDFASDRPGGRVARLGGDEFTVLLGGLGSEADIERVLDRLLDAVRAPIDCFGNEVRVTASIGVALFPQDGADVDTLLRRSDLAMYSAKGKGGDCWRRFEESMNRAAASRWHLEAGLHHALERKELVLHYQPLIDVDTGRIVAAEALMRWRRDGVIVPPGDFIQTAEESGLIVSFTEWALAEACAQMARWREAGLTPVPIAVNVSSSHFQRSNLVGPVRASLAANGLEPGMLRIELTETVLMRHLDSVMPQLQEIRRMGSGISIDDFGTGYSSLAYLRRLPIDTVKIDRSFVSEIEVSPDSATIVAAIIAMARALRMKIVAEGVETRMQMVALHGQGCSVMQGFLFSRPVPADQFAELIVRTLDGHPEWCFSLGGDDEVKAYMGGLLPED
jgi:predicted signal transduction protein with EAL and GGDEF domain/DNA-binding response OmpR family regulator